MSGLCINFRETGSQRECDIAVKVGVHQGSISSPLLFIIVLEALSKKFIIGLPWELFYADDPTGTVSRIQREAT